MVLVSAVRDYINRMLQDISGMKVLILDSHTVSSFPNTPLFISLFLFYIHALFGFRIPRKLTEMIYKFLGAIEISIFYV